MQGIILLRKGHKIMIEGHFSFKNNDGGLRSLFYGCNVTIFDNMDIIFYPNQIIICQFRKIFVMLVLLFVFKNKIIA